MDATTYDDTLYPPREPKSQAELLQQAVAYAAEQRVSSYGDSAHTRWFYKPPDYHAIELQAFQELNR